MQGTQLCLHVLSIASRPLVAGHALYPCHCAAGLYTGTKCCAASKHADLPAVCTVLHCSCLFALPCCHQVPAKLYGFLRHKLLCSSVPWAVICTCREMRQNMLHPVR